MFPYGFAKVKTSQLTTEFFEKFGIKVSHSSIAHPQSNPVERFHRTLKRLLRVLCQEAGTEWETHLPLALLALRTITHESLGFSPAELIYGKNLRTPGTLLYDKWLETEDKDSTVVEYVYKLLNRLKRSQNLAYEKMEEMQKKRKLWYDKNAVKRQFQKGDLVLSTNRPNKLAVQWVGPGTVEQQLSDTNYVVKITGKKERCQVYHVNMLKPYYKRPEFINYILEEDVQNSEINKEIDFPHLGNDPNIFDFDEIAKDSNLTERLNAEQIEQLRKLLMKYSKLFSNLPGETNLVEHDIDLVDDKPVRQKPYRASYRQNEILKQEVDKMLKMGVIEIGESDFTSPMILVEAPGKDPRPCIDYRRLNEKIRTEYFPLPNIEERVERVSESKYITVLDLAKGYWQIPLTKRAQRIAAFVTAFGTYRPLKMPFGLKNAPFCFSKMMFQILRGCEGFAVPYLDDIAVFSDDWVSHLRHVGEVLERISQALLTIKPSKCRFGQEQVQYLGHMVGSGIRSPAEAKIASIINFPRPTNKTQLRAFLGLTGFYSHYIHQYSVLAAPLTNMLRGKLRKGKIEWSSDGEQAFNTLKKKLVSKPVLHAPDFSKDFLVQVDASETGIGVILAQKFPDGEHPIVFLSKKFSDVEKRYSTTERECAGIIFAVKKLHYYLDGHKFIIITDHNPLTWLQKNSGSNAKLLRWSLALQAYDFSIIHKPGKEHANADCLSRA